MHKGTIETVLSAALVKENIDFNQPAKSWYFIYFSVSDSLSRKLIMTFNYQELVMFLLCLVNHTRTNSVIYENVTCEDLAAANTTPSHLYFNKPRGLACDESENETNIVTIGFLGSYGQAQVLLGALPLAVEAVNNDESKYSLNARFTFI